MSILKRKVFVVYKEYRNWEDDDSNGAEILQVSKKIKKATESLRENYTNELQFFIENDIKIIEKNCSDSSYYIETSIGYVEGYIEESEVA